MNGLVDWIESTPLIHASKAGHIPFIRLFYWSMVLTSNVNQQDDTGCIPLCWSGEYGRVADFFLDNDADCVDISWGEIRCTRPVRMVSFMSFVVCWARG